MTVTLSREEFDEMIGAVSPDISVPYANLLIYGDPGTGKTRLAGTAGIGVTGPALLADIEAGVTTLKKPVPQRDVKVKQIRSMDAFEKLVNDLYNNPGIYNTFIVDGITELQKLDMVTTMHWTKKNAKNPDNIDVDVPSPREWGKSGEHIRRICRAARDLPMHTIFTALEAQETDDLTDITRYYPSIPGKLKNELAGFFDIVGRLEAKSVPNKPGEVKRTLQTAKTNKVAAKDRFDILPQVMDDPTIPAIWELINQT